MNDTITADDIIATFASFTRGEINEGDNGIKSVLVTLRNLKMNLTVNMKVVEALANEYNGKMLHEKTGVYDDTTYEILVREESPFPTIRMRRNISSAKNDANGFTYELSACSDVYLVWLSKEVERSSDNQDRKMDLYNYNHFQMEQEFKKWDGKDLLDFLHSLSHRFQTIKIKASEKTSPTQFMRQVYAYLFHIGYNLDVAVVPIRVIDDVFRRSRLARVRRSRWDDLVPPCRTYNEDLVRHYVLAVSTDNPLIEFLSYYHVIEHFFENVFNDDLIESVKLSITDPGFSYKRKKDIEQLIKKVRKAIQVRSGAITFSEPEALRLCLVRFVDLPDLRNKLDEYDSSICDYYKTSVVPFANGPTFDIVNQDDEQVYKLLANRIYSTRNALVHSKEGDTVKFIPFKDDTTLIKELPLMRFIAESIIINESSIQ